MNGENMPVACAVCKRAAILKRPKTVIYGFIVRTDTTGLLCFKQMILLVVTSFRGFYNAADLI